MLEEIMSSVKDAQPVVKEVSMYHPSGEYNSIKAITYDGMPNPEGKTKVFAYFGFPKSIKDKNKIPAIILVHGGGGHAYLNWMKMWTDRGYAAIAMDTTGFFPNKLNAGTNEWDHENWTYGLTEDFKEEGYVDSPKYDNMENSEKPLNQQWMYYALGSIIIANNILRNESRIDSTKIGITGISWGGVITSLAIAFDDRFAFAIPVYGSGYLGENMGGINSFYSDETQKVWLAEKNFDKVNMPVLWHCWNDDPCFSINSNSKSYEATALNNKHTALSMVNKMFHSHSYAWNRTESLLFADAVCNDEFRLPIFANQPKGKYFKCKINFKNNEDIEAKLYYITSKIKYELYDKFGEGEHLYMIQQWQTTPCEVKNNIVRGIVPDDAREYYVELKTQICKEEYVVCSRFIER